MDLRTSNIGVALFTEINKNQTNKKGRIEHESFHTRPRQGITRNLNGNH